MPKIIRWDKTVLRELPWYQEILKEGLERGLQQEEISLVLRQLIRRFGDIDFSVREKIQTLLIAQLESLRESLLDFTELQDLTTWLENNT